MSRRENRLIFHVDVNSAYLSWEAARRVAEGGADLRSIPSAIGGDPEKRTGVILAKSVPRRFRLKPASRWGRPCGNAPSLCWPGRILGCITAAPGHFWPFAAGMPQWWNNFPSTNAFWI